MYYTDRYVGVCDGEERERERDACTLNDNHCFEHLCRCDDWLSDHVTLVNHHFLCQCHLLNGDLHTQVTTSHHNAIGDSKHFIKVVQTFLTLNLGNNLDPTMDGA